MPWIHPPTSRSDVAPRLGTGLLLGLLSSTASAQVPGSVNLNPQPPPHVSYVTFVDLAGSLGNPGTQFDGPDVGRGVAWVDVVGTLDGKRQGVAIMVHPSHPDFPVKWILRPKRSMQNPQWPGREAMTLDPQHEVRLRYRLVLHVGDLAHDELEAIWQDFAKST